jgi:hypothetical protein
MKGFYARPKKEADGSLNLLFWEVGIPGRAGVSIAFYFPYRSNKPLDRQTGKAESTN